MRGEPCTSSGDGDGAERSVSLSRVRRLSRPGFRMPVRRGAAVTATRRRARSSYRPSVFSAC
jgi:hypothetical protein